MKNLLSKISNGVKDYQEEIVLFIGVVLISLLSFAIGFIVAKNQEKEPLKIEKNTSASLGASYFNSTKRRG